MSVPKIDRVEYREDGYRVTFVAVMDDGTEEPRLSGTRVLEREGLSLIDCGSLHVVVRPRPDGSVGSWFEVTSRDDGMRCWIDCLTGRKGRE